MVNLKPRVWTNLKVVVGNVYDQEQYYHEVAVGKGLASALLNFDTVLIPNLRPVQKL